jgi:plasmid stability protein
MVWRIIMASLTVRDIPDTVLKHLRHAAAEEQRSVNAQAVYWIEQGARQWVSGQEREKLLAEIRSSRRATELRQGRGSNSAAITRRMRDERAKSRSRSSR